MQSEVTTDLAELLPRLRAYAQVLTKNSHDADDLVQTTVERALSRIELYQPGTNFKAWMFTILRNCYFTEMRKRSRRPESVDPADHEGALSVPAVQQNGLEVRDFSRAFAKLTEMDRTVLILVGAEGMSYQEAADVLGTPIGTVRSRLSRARMRLKDLLEGTVAPLRGESPMREGTESRAAGSEPRAGGKDGGRLDALVG
ncbi:MAG: sigma-70 family RNA polymerase sigma factor [Tistlia sp.]|uniref:sigma-70 family RNA polymerase sigma factor n=1 Tax=Tistlia sp. TaxID=3057121 RepID=UPI0034A1CD6C